MCHGHIDHLHLHAVEEVGQLAVELSHVAVLLEDVGKLLVLKQDLLLQKSVLGGCGHLVYSSNKQVNIASGLLKEVGEPGRCLLIKLTSAIIDLLLSTLDGIQKLRFLHL